MTSRVLPSTQYSRLIGTELEGAVNLLPPDARVVVVEDAERILGCWALVPFIHCEGIWIAPEHRGKSSVARRLWMAMCDMAQMMGAKTVLTGSCSDAVTRLLEHAGAVALPGTTYAIRVTKD